MPEKEQELLPVRIWESVKTFGLRAFFASFSDSSRMLPRAYEPWLFRHRASEEQLRAQRKKGAGRKTSLTLVTVLKEADPQAFADMLASLKGQTFSGFELLLIDLTAFGDGGTDLQAELRSAAAEAAHSGLRLRHFPDPEGRVRDLGLPERREARGEGVPGRTPGRPERRRL